MFKDRSKTECDPILLPTKLILKLSEILGTLLMKVVNLGQEFYFPD